MRFAITLILLLILPAAHGSVTTVVVTKDNQQKHELPFTLTLTEHPDRSVPWVHVKLVLPVRGKLERLTEVVVMVMKEPDLELRVPLEVKKEAGVWTGTLNITPDLAKRSIVRLVCPAPVVEPGQRPLAVTTYDIQLGTYVGK